MGIYKKYFSDLYSIFEIDMHLYVNTSRGKKNNKKSMDEGTLY